MDFVWYWSVDYCEGLFILMLGWVVIVFLFCFVGGVYCKWDGVECWCGVIEGLWNGNGDFWVFLIIRGG